MMQASIEQVLLKGRDLEWCVTSHSDNRESRLNRRLFIHTCTHGDMQRRGVHTNCICCWLVVIRVCDSPGVMRNSDCD